MLFLEIAAESPTFTLAETARRLWSADQATKRGPPMKRKERKDVPMLRIMRQPTRKGRKQQGIIKCS